MSIEMPLFPLRSVLCPGVALPLHIFEDRYRLMIARCIERSEPFGVVLVRSGPDVGPIDGRMAEIGTTAAIRRAGRYPDGRLDILTVGEQRFRLESVDTESEPYIVARVTLLDEPTGPTEQALDRAERVGRRFLRYLDLLQAEGATDGPEIEIEFEIEVDDAEGQADPAAASGRASDDAADPDTDAGGEPRDAGEAVRLEAAPFDEFDDATEDVIGAEPLVSEMDTEDLSPEQRRELLMAAARRLTSTDDPTALSYVLTALIQVDLAARQELLEAPDTVERLDRLNGLLTRESWFLQQGLRPIIIDASQHNQGSTPR